MTHATDRKCLHNVFQASKAFPDRFSVSGECGTDYLVLPWGTSCCLCWDMDPSWSRCYTDNLLTPYLLPTPSLEIL